MTSPEPSPLTAEEQALAERLARLAPRVEPSPALDARVLAAAHAAAQEPPANRLPPRRQRWPAMVGLAASVLLAVGLAWRLRPEAPQTPRESFHMAAPSAPAATAPAPDAGSPPPVATPQPSPDASVAAQAPVAEPGSSAANSTTGRVSDAAPPTRSRKVLDVTTPGGSPPPPPPEVLRDVAARARAAAPAAPAPAPAAAPAPPPTAEDSGLDDSANEADRASAFSAIQGKDEPADEVPPATVESPAVRDAWLQRIQRLIDAGDIAGARASLREFQRRYPDYPLPEDLRALAR